MKHIPQRTCICCRKKFAKEQVLRIVKYNGQFLIDENQKHDGRGAYFCGSEECQKKLLKSRGLDRAFKEKVNESVYQLVLNHFTDKKDAENGWSKR